MNADLREFEGTYRGLSPTLDSPIGVGEMEVTFSGGELKVRFATGVSVLEKTYALGQSLLQLLQAEVAGFYRKGSPYAARTVCFRDQDGNNYLFLDAAGGGEYGLVMCPRPVGDSMGPTFFYTPKDVALGLFDLAIASAERACGRPVLPRLP